MTRAGAAGQAVEHGSRSEGLGVGSGAERGGAIEGGWSHRRCLSARSKEARNIGCWLKGRWAEGPRGGRREGGGVWRGRGYHRQMRGGWEWGAGLVGVHREGSEHWAVTATPQAAFQGHSDCRAGHGLHGRGSRGQGTRWHTPDRPRRRQEAG